MGSFDSLTKRSEVVNMGDVSVRINREWFKDSMDKRIVHAWIEPNQAGEVQWSCDLWSVRFLVQELGPEDCLAVLGQTFGPFHSHGWQVVTKVSAPAHRFAAYRAQEMLWALVEGSWPVPVTVPDDLETMD